ncbi:MAG: CBS domain-containing protein [Dehalococcoidia bacterium]|nr:CBS domain-containing protein [Dehalococcoidia bacterium]
MDVQEIMTPNPYCLNITDTIQHAAQEMKQHNIGVLPVCAGDTLAGIITDRDIVLGCVASGSLPGQCLVKEYMTANPFNVSPQTNIEEALQVMSREQIRRLCVIQNGHVVGMLSLGDLVQHLPNDSRISQALAQISEPVRGQLPVGVA